MNEDPYKLTDEDFWVATLHVILSNKDGYYHGLDPFVSADMALTAFKMRFRE